MTVVIGEALDEARVTRGTKVAHVERVSSGYPNYSGYWRFRESKRRVGILLGWRLNRARRREYLRRCEKREWCELPEARVIK